MKLAEEFSVSRNIPRLIGEYRIYKCRKLMSRELKLKPEIKVLDIGFGDGRVACALWSASQSFDITGVEINGKLCKNVKENVKRGNLGKNTVAVVQADSRYIPFKENAFGLVYCGAVLHHVRNVRQVISEIYRVTEGNGSAIAIKEPTKLNPLRGLARFLEPRLKSAAYSLSMGTEPLETTFCSWQLRGYFNQAGFDKTNSGPMWLPYYTKSRAYFRLWLLFEKLVEKTPIPYIFGQLFVTGVKKNFLHLPV